MTRIPREATQPDGTACHLCGDTHEIPVEARYDPRYDNFKGVVGRVPCPACIRRNA